MVARQDYVVSDYRMEGHRKWLESYCRSHDMNKISFSCVPFRGKELGERRFGDGACWCIPCKRSSKYRVPR